MIRIYKEEDRKGILEILDLNTPKYFDPTERSEFVRYLDCELEDYFIYENKGKIVAGAGLNYFQDDGYAKLSWGMVHPLFQRQGIGSKLSLHRVQVLRDNPIINRAVVRTSQHVFEFYKKLGFTLYRVVENYWADSFHLYEMHLDFNTYDE